MNIRSAIVFFLSITLGVYSLLYIFKDLTWQELKTALEASDLKWIFLAIAAHLINHALRSYRWSLLLNSQKEKPSFKQAYLAEMSGFCVNAAGLRGGELVRCIGLKKMYGTPINRSLATVIVERVVDIVFFFIMLAFFFITFFNPIKTMIAKILANPQHEEKNPGGINFWYFVLISSLFFTALAMIFQKKNKMYIKQWWEKSLYFFQKLICAIKNAWKTNSYTFWSLTLLIWIFYFLLEYMSLFAFKETAQLTAEKGLAPAVCVFIALNISHLSPMGNGMGIYHAFIILVLQSFGVPKNTAAAYALVTHGIQVFNALIPGGICFLSVFSFGLAKNTRNSKTK